MEECVTINTLNDFLEAIKKLNILKEEENHFVEFFYRGHNDKGYTICPGIFRQTNINLLRYEDKIFKDVVINNHTEFRDAPTCLEKLVKMQHFGLPTRLLDITKAPLTALFYACYSQEEKPDEKEKDGEVIVFKIDDDTIKYYDSDNVSVLSNLCKLSCDRKKNTSELVHVIREEKSRFSEEDTIDIDQVFCVKVKKNNPRILVQDGLFLLFGSYCPTVQKKADSLVFQRICIPKDKKAGILSELEVCRINKEKLFPDIEHSIQAIVQKYK